MDACVFRVVLLICGLCCLCLVQFYLYVSNSVATLNVYDNQLHQRHLQFEKQQHASSIDVSKMETRVHADDSQNLLQKHQMEEILSLQSRSPLAAKEPVSPPVLSHRPRTEFLNVVHYIWCDQRIFEFQHYLSMKSVIAFLQPDRIIMHYKHYPRHDRFLYNTWFEDIKSEWPFIDLDDLGQRNISCKSDDAINLRLVQRMIGDEGGVYVQKNTIFTRSVDFGAFLKNGIVYGFSDKKEGFIIAARNKLKQFSHFGELKAVSMVHHRSCVSSDDYIQNPSKYFCLIKTHTVYPKNSWNQTDGFSQLVQTLFYQKGLRLAPVPGPADQELIPNIGHIIWLGGNEMNFLFYLSALSFLHVLKVEKLFFHGEKPPRGKYWEKLKVDNRVVFVKRVMPDLVYRTQVRVYQHMSDFTRIDILNKYGGIYADVDVIWIKALPRWLRRYGSVESYDWPQWYNTYPDYINFGVILGKRGDPFWSQILDSMKNFKDKFYGYNGILKPYKLYERDPSITLLYDKLQVMCWDLKCHPTWFPNWRKKTSSHLTGEAKQLNWRDSLSFHWTHPTPEELSSEEALFKSSGMFAEIGQAVLRAAGIGRKKT